MTSYQPDRQRYDAMDYARCGHSGVLLPKVSLGFWHNFGDTTAYSTARAIALAAFDNGITHFDLANNYGPEPGAAEECLGKLLTQELRPYRDELFLSTKAAYDMWEGPYGAWASRKHLFASLDQSLARMRLDYVDLFYCHRYDPNTPLEETLQALVDIVKQGKALYIGFSRWPLDALLQGIAYLQQHDTPLLIYQGRLNLLDRAPEQEGILAALTQHKKGFIAFSPLAQGLLTDRYLQGIPPGSRMTLNKFLTKDMLTERLLQTLHQLNALAQQRGQTLAQLALSWLLHHESVTSVLIGASSTQQLQSNLACLSSAPFTSDELAIIDNILTQ